MHACSPACLWCSTSTQEFQTTSPTTPIPSQLFSRSDPWVQMAYSSCVIPPCQQQGELLHPNHVCMDICIYRYLFLPHLYTKIVSFWLWKTEALFLHLEDKKESKIMVISLTSFLEDFVTITWIVHAVQRKNLSRIDRRITHTHVAGVCVCVSEGKTDGEWAVHMLPVSKFKSR